MFNILKTLHKSSDSTTVYLYSRDNISPYSRLLAFAGNIEI